MRKLSLSTIYISLEKGFCAEYKYRLSFKASSETYIAHNYEDINIMVDSEYNHLLRDIVVDYKTSLMVKKFYISTNPDALRKCGCGLTFTGKKK